MKRIENKSPANCRFGGKLNGVLFFLAAFALLYAVGIVSCVSPDEPDPEKTLQSIAITTPPTKTQYNLNDANLDTTGMVVTATYSDDSTAPVTGYTTSGFSSTMAGSKTITVTYEDKTTTFTVMVNAPGKTLLSIAITTPPTKTQYELNEPLDTAGMVVTAAYSDNTTPVISAGNGGYTMSSFDSSTAGSKTVTVSYGGKTADFTVMVNAPGEKTLESIAVTTPPTKTQYTVGESLNTAGMVVTATYSDGSTAVIPAGTGGYTTSGFSSSAVGPNTVTVSYGGKTDTFTVTINAPTLQSIAVTTQPTKRQYNLNEPLDTAGMVVTATYSNSTTAVIPAGANGYTTSGFSSSTVGPNVVTVTYDGKTTTFTVTVVDPNAGTSVTSWKGLSVPSASTALQYSSLKGKTDVLQVAPASTSSGYAWNVLSYDLAAYADQEITITVSMEVWLDISTKVVWQVNNTGYPTVCGNTSTALTAGQWHTVSGNATITPEANKALYLSKDYLVGNPASVGTPAGNVDIYITGFTVSIVPVGGNPPDGPVVTPTDSRILNPATTNTQLTGGTNFTSGGGNKSLTNSPYGVEVWIDAGGGSASFTWYGANQGGGAAFKANWASPDDFLGRIGYFWGNGSNYASYKNIYCGYNYTRSGRNTAGNYSYIGIYGWSRNPNASDPNERLIEYYIVEDWFGNQWQDDTGPMGTGTTGGDEVGSFTVDGSVYKIIKNVRVNKPSIDGDKTFTQYFSIRQTLRQNGTISITEHFKKWEELGMNLGNMYECKFLVEAGGGTGSFDARLIQFYRAENDGTILQITP